MNKLRMNKRKTKIVATVGHSTMSRSMVGKMIVVAKETDRIAEKVELAKNKKELKTYSTFKQ